MRTPGVIMQVRRVSTVRANLGGWRIFFIGLACLLLFCFGVRFFSHGFTRSRYRFSVLLVLQYLQGKLCTLYRLRPRWGEQSKRTLGRVCTHKARLVSSQSQHGAPQIPEGCKLIFSQVLLGGLVGVSCFFTSRFSLAKHSAPSPHYCQLGALG